MASVESINAYNFNTTMVHERSMLNYASLELNSNKYYYLEVQEDSNNTTYPYRVYTKFGRVNKKAKEDARYFSSLYDARSEYQSIKRKKTGARSSGSVYVEVELDDGTSPSVCKVQKAASTKAISPADNSVINNDKVLQLINKLYKITTSYLVKTIETPLGKLSAQQVAKGDAILDELERAIARGDSSSVLYLSNQFYSLIPHDFGMSADLAKLMINTTGKVADKRDLLAVINSVVNVQGSLESQLKAKYEALNIKLNALSDTDAEFNRIKSKIVKSHGNTHHFKIDVKNVYAVEDMTGYDNFNPKKVATMELFHGTRKENVLGIMQKGILIKPTNASHTGSMFGSGAYFADCSTKSAQYTDSFSNVRGDDQYMFICEVATGKIKEYDDAQPGLYAAPRGYNSVKGRKGSRLLYDEYIVFNTSQVKITHIVEFQKR